MTQYHYLENFIGEKVRIDIREPNGSLLIPSGTTLTEEHINKVYDRNLSLTEDHICILNEKELLNQDITIEKKIIDNVTEHSKELFLFIRKHEQIPLLEIRRDIVPVIYKIANNTDIFKIFRSLQADTDYTYRHNIGVGVLANLIGKWLNLSESELSELTLAATLHDVGKMKIPIQILNKPGRLTSEEYDEMKKHTIYGCALLKNTIGISPKIALVALQHHERIDGTGYPIQIKGDNIDFLSKIVAVADVFHAMNSNRIYQQSASFYQVVNEMNSGVFGKFEPNVIFVLINHITNTLTGRIVILSNGRKAKIILMNPYNPFKPLVKLGEKLIDLSTLEDVYLKEVL